MVEIVNFPVPLHDVRVLRIFNKPHRLPAVRRYLLQCLFAAVLKFSLKVFTMQVDWINQGQLHNKRSSDSALLLNSLV